MFSIEHTSPIRFFSNDNYLGETHKTEFKSSQTLSKSQGI